MKERDSAKFGRLQIASQRTDAEIAAEQARQDAERAALQLNSATRAMAANILRIIAGAGKDYALIEQVLAVLTAYQEMHPYAGTAAYPHSPVAPIREALIELDWRKNNPNYGGHNDPKSEERWLSDGTTGVRLAKDWIVRSALRVAASQLAQQPTQEHSALDQLSQALREYERARDERLRLVSVGKPSRLRRHNRKPERPSSA